MAGMVVLVSVELVVAILRSPGKLMLRSWMLEFFSVGSVILGPGPSMRVHFHFGDVLGFTALSSLQRTGDDPEIEAPDMAFQWRFQSDEVQSGKGSLKHTLGIGEQGQ